jgi:hypothetical protein
MLGIGQSSLQTLNYNNYNTGKVWKFYIYEYDQLSEIAKFLKRHKAKKVFPIWNRFSNRAL